MSRSGLKPGEDQSAYDYLWRLSPDRWAWEFLRRNAAFRRDAALRGAEDLSVMPAPCPGVRMLRPRTDQAIAERWGLVFMPDPAANGYDAQVVWNRYAFPDQVEVTCRPCTPDQRCEIRDRTLPHCDVTHVTDLAGREYVLVRRGGCVIQVRSTGMSLLSIEPVRMKLTISDVESYNRQIKVLTSVIELYSETPDLSAPRWTKTTEVLRNCLIALDCLDQGARRRDIAIALYGAKRTREEWHGPSMKHTVRYLVRKAEELREGGYLRELLHARTEKAGA